jgi:protein-S-isoprenylcysteine O-methyltransferase Ste14
MHGTTWEFRNRAAIFGLIFGVAFGFYTFDHQNAVAALANALAARFATDADRLARLLFGLAAALLAAGALIRTWASAYLHAGIVYAPEAKTAFLVADGPYRYVRNPLYFANLTLALGMGAMMSRAAFFVVVLAMGVFTYRLILYEEPLLRASRGASHESFCRAVPRLWPALRPRIPAAGSKANWRQGFRAEAWYWGFAAAVAAFAITFNLAVFYVILGASIALLWFYSNRAASSTGLCLALFVLAAFPQSRSAPADLTGVIDIHVHSDPDSVPRSIDALDLARLAKQRGMRALVLKNHYESTAALAYVVRKEVPGIEVFGGIDLNRSVGGINPAAIERMVLMKGGWGRVIWMPTFDAQNQVRYSHENRPFVPVARDGRLLPEVEQVIALAAKNHLLLETGHSSAEEGLLIVREARRQGVEHVVVTHAMKAPVHMTIPQMQQAAAAGAYIELDYGGLVGRNPEFRIADYTQAIRAVGPRSCILSSDLGQPGNPLHPDGLAAFFRALRREGFSQADIDLMSKINPARALGLE